MDCNGYCKIRSDCRCLVSVSSLFIDDDQTLRQQGESFTITPRIGEQDSIQLPNLPMLARELALRRAMPLDRSESNRRFGVAVEGHRFIAFFVVD
jgi:hypothetical protein